MKNVAILILLCALMSSCVKECEPFNFINDTIPEEEWIDKMRSLPPRITVTSPFSFPPSTTYELEFVESTMSLFIYKTSPRALYITYQYNNDGYLIRQLIENEWFPEPETYNVKRHSNNDVEWTA